MKVVRVRGFLLEAALAEPLGNALTSFDRRGALLVELLGEDGTVGWGEAWAAPEAAAAHIRAHLAPLVLGQDAAATTRLWRAMMGTLHYDRRGVAGMAVAALDIALHDMVARERGISVAALLGGALRTRVPAYASGPFLKPGDDPYRHYPAEVEALGKRGFRACKPRAGFSPAADGAMALAVRRALGPDAAVMVDYNQGYTARAAIASARYMAAADLLWLEEPVLPEDVAGYCEVARAVVPAVAGGEALGSLAAFRAFLDAGALGILQPDLTIAGGFTGVGRVAVLADAFDLPLMPHVWGTSVNFCAALQMAAVLPARRGGAWAPYPFIEYDITGSPLMELGGPPGLEPDGTVCLPDAPGLGLVLDAEALRPWVKDAWEIDAG